MEKTCFVCLYYDYLETFRCCSDREVGILVMAMLDYAIDGTQPQLPESLRRLWPTFRSQIDRDQEKYRKVVEACRANGRKGGRPRKPK